MKKRISILNKIKDLIRKYIINNYKEYLLVFILFLIGIFIGVIILNNCSEDNLTSVSTYIQDFINKFKEAQNINTNELILSSIKNNTILTLIIWFAGTTVVGIPIVLGIIFIRGLSLGYTISTCIYTLGLWKGIGFNLSALLFQSILFIPAILTLGVSSIKLYKSILKDRRKENIKIEIIRHTLISLIMLTILILSSFVENTVSMFILKSMIKYI